MLKSLVCGLNTRTQNVTVADPDPPPLPHGSRPSDRGKGWGGGHPDPEIREGGVRSPKNISSALRFGPHFVFLYSYEEDITQISSGSTDRNFSGDFCTHSINT